MTGTYIIGSCMCDGLVRCDPCADQVIVFINIHISTISRSITGSEDNAQK